MSRKKEETSLQYQKRKAREQKQLLRLEREISKPQSKFYIWYFILIITIVYIVVEVTTQIGPQMQSIIASQIFAPVFGEENAVARMTIFNYICMIGSGLTYLYKPLSDKFGRKPFLVLNTFGMRVSMFLGNFFIPHDMQSIYIMECVPKEKK